MQWRRASRQKTFADTQQCPLLLLIALCRTVPSTSCKSAPALTVPLLGSPPLYNHAKPIRILHVMLASPIHLVPTSVPLLLPPPVQSFDCPGISAPGTPVLLKPNKYAPTFLICTSSLPSVIRYLLKCRHICSNGSCLLYPFPPCT